MGSWHEKTIKVHRGRVIEKMQVTNAIGRVRLLSKSELLADLIGNHVLNRDPGAVGLGYVRPLRERPRVRRTGVLALGEGSIYGHSRPRCVHNSRMHADSGARRRLMGKRVLVDLAVRVSFDWRYYP